MTCVCVCDVMWCTIWQVDIVPSAKMTEPTGTYSNYSSPKVRGTEELPRPKVAAISSEAR